MDGNGRWAQRRGRSRMTGHRMGAAAVRRVVREAATLGIEQLTLFAFSTENWGRPRMEVSFLMRLIRRFLRGECGELRRNGIRLRAIGRFDELPGEVRSELERTISLTRGGGGMTLCLALNYGGRAELTDACRELVREAAAGGIGADGITEERLAARLYQPEMPALDLIIRTGGEMRLSNFLLWQAAYSELWFTQLPWPDFAEEDFRRAVADFGSRMRRFGGAPPAALEVIRAGEIQSEEEP